MKNYVFLKNYTRPYRKNYFLGGFFSILSVIFIMLLPQITQLFIDSVYSFSNTDTGNLGVIWYWLISKLSTISTTEIVLVLSITFIVCAILKNLTSVLATQNFFRGSSNSCGDIRKDCFKKLAFADRNISTKEIYFNFTDDIGAMYGVLYTILPLMITLPLTIILASAFCFIISWQIALSFIVFVPIILVAGYITNVKLVSMFNESRNRKSDMVKVSEELIYEIREIKAFSNEKWAVEKYNRYNQKHSQLTKDSNNFVNKSNLLLNIIRVIGLAFAIIFCAFACFNGTISIGYFVLLLSYAFIILNATVDLVNNYYDWGVGFIGVSRLSKLINTKSHIKPNKHLKIENPEIRFFNVDLVLNGKKIFNNLNLRMEYGKHYALILQQGQGKTALAKLFLRFLSHTNGKIYFNNIAYENYDIVSLRKQFSYISQQPVIFEGTIAENIVMFERVDEELLKKVIKICDLTTVVKKYDESNPLVEKDVNIVSQERQKINIARALYRNAPVLLIDSAFNKFTPEFTQKIIKRILKEYKDRTVIFLAEKKEEVKQFENVIMLNKMLSKGGKK